MDCEIQRRKETRQYTIVRTTDNLKVTQFAFPYTAFTDTDQRAQEKIQSHQIEKIAVQS